MMIFTYVIDTVIRPEYAGPRAVGPSTFHIQVSVQILGWFLDHRHSSCGKDSVSLVSWGFLHCLYGGKHCPWVGRLYGNCR